MAFKRVHVVEEIETVPYVPPSHPFVKRLIGALRCECLDHILSWNPLDLERKLASFRDYYNGTRVHASLDGQIPAQASGRDLPNVATLDDFRRKRHGDGLYQLPEAG